MDVKVKAKIENIAINLTEEEAYDLNQLILFAFDLHAKEHCLTKSEEELGRKLTEKLDAIVFKKGEE